MPVARLTITEVLRALGVLALVFLSFAQAPVAAVTTGPAAIATALDMSYCGDLPDDPKAHAPCHACRTGSAAALPPPCDMAIPVTVVADIAYDALPSLGLLSSPPRSFDARGPPLA